MLLLLLFKIGLTNCTQGAFMLYGSFNFKKLKKSSGSHSTEMQVCCSVLQCVAVCCSVLQYVAVCCSVLQCVAECCSFLKNAKKGSGTIRQRCKRVAVCCCSVLQGVAGCCSVLQCVVTCVATCVVVRCSVLQCDSECCSVLKNF